MWCCSLSKTPQPVDPDTTVKPPPITNLVDKNIDERRVRWSKIAGSILLLVVGIAMIVLASLYFTMTYQNHGWAREVALHYAALGTVGLLGVGITGLAVKWLIESYQKWKRFQAIANIVD